MTEENHNNLRFVEIVKDSVLKHVISAVTHIPVKVMVFGKKR